MDKCPQDWQLERDLPLSLLTKLPDGRAEKNKHRSPLKKNPHTLSWFPVGRPG